MSRRRLCDVSNVSQRCFSDVLVMFFEMSRFCFGGVPVMCQSYVGLVSAMLW